MRRVVPPHWCDNYTIMTSSSGSPPLAPPQHRALLYFTGHMQTQIYLTLRALLLLHPFGIEIFKSTSL